MIGLFFGGSLQIVRLFREVVELITPQALFSSVGKQQVHEAELQTELADTAAPNLASVRERVKIPHATTEQLELWKNYTPLLKSRNFTRNYETSVKSHVFFVKCPADDTN
jgi:hypothetical protein